VSAEAFEPSQVPKCETWGTHSFDGDLDASHPAGAEFGYWLGPLAKKLGLRIPALAYVSLRFVSRPSFTDWMP